MAKTTKIYGIRTADSTDGACVSFKAYCATREIAEREVVNYHDSWNPDPAPPDDKHIIPLDLIIE